MPDEPEALGLLALMLLHDARRAARVDAAGDLVTLEDQDRDPVGPAPRSTRVPGCSRPRCAEAAPGLTSCRRRSRPATPPSADAADTDWAEIALLYGELAPMVPSPVVELNRAVAVAMADGPAAGPANWSGPSKRPAR